MSKTKNAPAYHPLYDGVSAAHEAASLGAKRRPKVKPIARLAASQATTQATEIAEEPAAGPEELPQRVTAQPREAATPPPPTSPGPIVSILYVAQDLRSFPIHGPTNLWPAVTHPDWGRLVFGPEAAPAVFHRLTPQLWVRLEGQLSRLWAQLVAKGDVAGQGRLLDLVEPIVDYVREQGWPIAMEEES